MEFANNEALYNWIEQTATTVQSMSTNEIVITVIHGKEDFMDLLDNENVGIYIRRDKCDTVCNVVRDVSNNSWYLD